MSRSSSPSGSKFAGFGLDAKIMSGIAAAGFINPRPIQSQTVPAVLEGRDVLGLAQTGTGKTAAFAIPVLHRLLRERKPGSRVLIVAPTRELARQISDEIRLLAGRTRVRVATVFGGVPLRPQVNALRQRPEIIVACPGRLLDLYRRGALTLDRVETLILDEADHMFDMGFLPDIRQIIAALPRKRQNLLFSATMPKEIRGLADRILQRPKVVDLTEKGTPRTIEHAIFPIDEKQKRFALEQMLSTSGFVSAIVFTRTKQRAKRLAQELCGKGHRAVALQGNMTQGARQRAMEGFRKNRFEILVATDIAARGIDVAQVSHVINFDMPDTPEAYKHRIGRTGRSEREGKAYTFVTGKDQGLVRQVERLIGARIPLRRMEGVEGPESRNKARAAAVADRRPRSRRSRRAKPRRAASRS